ncbi:MAG TPA: hypothetical protein VIV60_27570 [Polyangiaceae bacterium]
MVISEGTSAMSKNSRSTVYVVGAVVMTAVGLFGIAPAQSRSPTHEESMGVCAKRVSELEAEVRALREELRLANGRSAFTSAKGARSNEPSRRVASGASGIGHHSTTESQPSTCDPPYNIDRQGIKSYNPDCLSAEDSSPCATPFSYTASGIKYYNPSCLDVAAARSSCDPPFYFDANGVKRYRSECL